ncbi:DUF1381 domain-containing protein [Staphylococcus aureus]|uniref:DUF1381 domain-containing protein n=1 Tax=Staphylococcus aureus TaxID=1280 RepID=UPI001F42407A|nr:DUF1381 domain-containing protein [Staphylococcus aureus]
MTQYLVTTFKDSTGRKHTHITKAKSNQRFTVCLLYTSPSPRDGATSRMPSSDIRECGK